MIVIRLAPAESKVYAHPIAAPLEEEIAVYRWLRAVWGGVPAAASRYLVYGSAPAPYYTGRRHPTAAAGRPFWLHAPPTIMYHYHYCPARRADWHALDRYAATRSSGRDAYASLRS